MNNEILEEKNRIIQEYEEKTKRANNEITANEILKNIDGEDENDNIYKETVSKYLKEPDGEKSLTMFIYVLHNKMKRYEEELEQSIFILIKSKK